MLQRQFLCKYHELQLLRLGPADWLNQCRLLGEWISGMSRVEMEHLGWDETRSVGV